jgi:hypothetical protein
MVLLLYELRKKNTRIVQLTVYEPTGKKIDPQLRGIPSVTTGWHITENPKRVYLWSACQHDGAYVCHVHGWHCHSLELSSAS